jgi:hypothetical protein
MVGRHSSSNAGRLALDAAAFVGELRDQAWIIHSGLTAAAGGEQVAERFLDEMSMLSRSDG